MAFMGIFIFWVFFLILCVIVGFGVIMLIIGIVLKVKKRKKSSMVFFVLSGGAFDIVLLVLAFIFLPHSQTVPTPSGEAKIKPSWIRRYNDALETHDIKSLRKLAEKHPEIVYYSNANLVMLLDYGFYNCDIEIMQTAIDNGAKFDEPLRYNHMTYYSSFDSFFRNLDYPSGEKKPEDLTVKGVATDKMIKTVEFAIDNGAATEWDVYHPEFEPDNLFDSAFEWLDSDGRISEKDDKLLMLIANSSPAMKEKYDKWKTNTLYT